MTTHFRAYLRNFFSDPHGNRRKKSSKNGILVYIAVYIGR